MLYVSGIKIIVKKAAIEISLLSHAISFNALHIIDPTIISAGAVTAEVMTVNNGENAKDTMNNPATIMLENPVFAPTEIPDNDSK